MEISKELLQKYTVGNCNEQERQAVEFWLNSGGKFPETKYERLFEPRKEIVRQKLYQRLWHNYKGLGRTTKKIIRLSVAACVLFGAFFGGRLSASTKARVTFKSPKFQEHLYIMGDNEVRSDLPGERFVLKFDGKLRLFNASKKPQTLIVGDSVFTLKKERTYHLIGSTDRAELFFEGQRPFENYEQSHSKGDFSIVRLDR